MVVLKSVIIPSLASYKINSSRLAATQSLERPRIWEVQDFTDRLWCWIARCCGLKATVRTSLMLFLFKLLSQFFSMTAILAHLGLPAACSFLLNLRRWFGGISTFSSLRILRTVEKFTPKQSAVSCMFCDS
jgi:hypothetical protein